MLGSGSVFSPSSSPLSPVKISSSDDLFANPVFDSSGSVKDGVAMETDNGTFLTRVELRRKGLGYFVSGEGEGALVPLVTNSDARRALTAGVGELDLLGGRLRVLVVVGAGDAVR